MAVDSTLFTVPDHRGLKRRHFLKRLDSLFRPVFLKKTKNRIHDKDDNNHHAIYVFVKKKRDDDRSDEYVHDKAVKLR